MAESISIRTVGICGAGQMGAAAAVCFKRAGFKTLLCLRNPAKLPAAEQSLKEMEAWMEKQTGAASASGGDIEVTTDLQLLDSHADVLLDGVAESMEVKTELFSRFPQAKKRGSIFLTTTSGLSITEMGRKSGIEHQLVGTHFWNPPHLMPLVEVIRGEGTDPVIFESVVELMEKIGKIPVRVNKDVPGFIGNRLLHALWREAINLIQQGIAQPEDVDKVARLTFGLRLPAVGPLENMDLVGLDLIETIHGYLLADLSGDPQPLPQLKQMVKDGDLGMKSGKGFYDWKTRNPKELVERRDQQIVRQLEYLKSQNAL